MVDPPLPSIPSDFIRAIAALLWRFFGSVEGIGDVGDVTLSDGTAQSILMASTGPGSIAWAVAKAAPSRFPAYRITRLAFDVLRSGEVASDGSISFEGRRYWVRACYVNGQHVAVADPA